MSYDLLWIEGLAIALFWVATSLAIAARIRRRLWAGLFLFISLGIVILVYGALVAASALMKFHQNLEVNWFAYCLSLFVASAVGSAVLFVAARRREEPGMARAAAGWPLGRLGLALAAAIALDAMTLWNMDLAVTAEAANLRIEAGAMLLAVAPPQVEDDRNAAVLYQKAFTRMKDDKSFLAEDSPLEQDNPDLTGPAVAQLLAHQATTLRLLRQAASMPACRFEHDYVHPSITMLLPELNQCRAAALLLALDARHASVSGQQRKAVEDVNAVFRLSRAAGSDPIIISALVEIGLDQIGIKVLQDVLPHVGQPDELSALHIGDESSISRLARRSLEGEEAFGLSIFSDLAAGRFTLLQLASPARSPDANTVGLPPLPLLMRVFVMPSDVRAYQSYMQSFQARVTEPYALAAGQASEDVRVAKHHGLLTATIVPGLTRFLLQVTLDKASHAAAWAGIAVDRYRLDHGTFPTSLDALVPQYLDEVPLDPFDNRPLRFRIHGGEALIYSIGPDGKDDGGTPFDPKMETGDLVFTVKTPMAPQGAVTAPTSSRSAPK